MPVLDVFKQDAFSVKALTDAINAEDFIPGIAGQVVGWQESGVTTTSIMLEEKSGVIRLVDPTPRGYPGAPGEKAKRTARSLTIPHYEVPGAVMADEVQGIRAFGANADVVQSVVEMVNQRTRELVQLSIDPTLEYQRIGAVKGVIMNGDGSTLYDLFDEFGVTQETEVDCNLDADGSATGAFRKVVNDIIRKITGNLKGTPFRTIRAFCGAQFFDALVTNAEVVRQYLNWQAAAELSGNMVYKPFPWGGIEWIEYRGAVGATSFVDTTKAHIFPVGVPGLFRTVYAPADYVETVNTNGLPRYARQYEMPNGKGVHLDAQSNALKYCTRPKVLIKARNT